MHCRVKVGGAEGGLGFLISKIYFLFQQAFYIVMSSDVLEGIVKKLEN